MDVGEIERVVVLVGVLAASTGSPEPAIREIILGATIIDRFSCWRTFENTYGDGAGVHTPFSFRRWGSLNSVTTGFVDKAWDGLCRFDRHQGIGDVNGILSAVTVEPFGVG